MSSKKQTAVEWLNQMLVSKGIFFEYELYQQAKSMEKEQIMDAYENGNMDEYDACDFNSGEKYYKQTYE